MPCAWTLTWIQIGYTIDDIGSLPGDTDSRGLDLNQLPHRDQVAGYSGSSHAILWEKQVNQAPVLLDLEALFPPGAPSSAAMALNNQFPSVVVGSHDVIGPQQPTPVLWEKLKRTPLPTIAEREGRKGIGEARGVNDSNVIVGWSSDAGGARLASRWILGLGWQVESLGTLGGSSSEANDVNQVGTVVGHAAVAAGTEHAFRWHPGGVLQDIHQGPGISSAQGVNIHDEVVGEADPATPAQSQAFLWSPSGGWQILPALPGASRALATDINDQGVVVGQSSSNGHHAVVWHGTQIARLTDQILQNPGWQLMRAEAINNRGQIAGFGKNPAGNIHAWLLTPVKLLIPQLTCYREFSRDRMLPSQIIGQIAVDGGGIIVTAAGALVHVRPPRPDPAPMLANVVGLQGLLDLAFEGRAQRGERAGRVVAEMAKEIAEREARRVLEDLARASDEDTKV